MKRVSGWEWKQEVQSQNNIYDKTLELVEENLLLTGLFRFVQYFVGVSLFPPSCCSQDWSGGFRSVQVCWGVCLSLPSMLLLTGLFRGFQVCSGLLGCVCLSLFSLPPAAHRVVQGCSGLFERISLFPPSCCSQVCSGLFRFGLYIRISKCSRWTNHMFRFLSVMAKMKWSQQNHTFRFLPIIKISECSRWNGLKTTTCSGSFYIRISEWSRRKGLKTTRSGLVCILG